MEILEITKPKDVASAFALLMEVAKFVGLGDVARVTRPTAEEGCLMFLVRANEKVSLPDASGDSELPDAA